MTGAWIALLGLGGHFPKALSGTFCLHAAESGIPTGASFYRSRLYFSEDEGKGWVTLGWSCLEERDH